MTTISQTEKILRHLKRGYSITAAQAMYKFRCYRLAARIREMREQGHDIVTEMVTQDDARFARYRLAR